MNKKKQAVILAAGKSSRFVPFSDIGHKSFIKIMGKAVIAHTILSLKKAGIVDIIVVVSKTSPLKELIGDFRKIGVNLTYVVQEEPLGMGDGLLAAEKYINSDFYVLHAHHVEFYQFKDLLETKKKEADAVLLAKKDTVLDRYGVLEVKGDRVLALAEKPEKGKEFSNLRVVGIYLLSKAFLKTLREVPLEHYHFEKALDLFARTHEVRVCQIDKETVLLKYAWDALALKNFLLKDIAFSISKNIKIDKSVVIEGNVQIEDGATIMEGVCLKGPCYIGKNVYIGTNALLRDGADIEKGCKIGSYMEIKNSLILENTTTHSGFIGDSVIGSFCKIAGSFHTANVRLDRKPVQGEIKGEKVDSGQNHLGVIMGSNVRIGINVSTMPGVLIGRNTIIGPSTTVLKNVKDNVKYYTKFQEIVEEKNKNDMFAKEKVVLFDIDYTLFDTDVFKKTKLEKYHLYEEALEVIEKLQKIAKLGIFSEGQLDFQIAKLLNTKIHNHFMQKHIHISSRKEDIVKQVIKKYNDSMLFLVDDKLPILYHAKSHNPSVFTIWIKRGIYAKNQKPIPGFKPDAEVSDLREIVKLVESQPRLNRGQSKKS